MAHDTKFVDISIVIRSIQVNGQTFQVSYKYFRFESIRHLSQTRIVGPVYKQNIIHLHIATGKMDNHTVIVGVVDPFMFEDLWSFEIGMDLTEYIQQQMRLPICVLCDEKSIVYIKPKEKTSDMDISLRIRCSDLNGFL